MPSQEFIEEENYKAQLRRHEAFDRANFDHMLMYDRASVDVGLVALRTAIGSNAGVIAAIVAFVAPAWARGDVSSAMIAKLALVISPFVIRLILAMVSCLFAYLYQGVLTAQKAAFRNFKAKQPYDEAPKEYQCWVQGFGWPMLAAGVGSLVMFICGVIRLANAVPS